MAAGDLTTLAHLKAWLDIPADNTTSDVLLQRLITAASKFIVRYCNRSFEARPYVETYNGFGQTFMVVRQWPVSHVSSLVFGGLNLTTPAQGNPPQNGFNFAPDGSGPPTIVLFGYCFPQQRNGVVVSYVAGYQTAELHEITQQGDSPDFTYDVVTDITWLGPGFPPPPLAGPVVYADDKTALTLVASAPAVGQYTLSKTGVYGFNVADVGEEVLITYSFVPQDLEQACWELVGQRYNVMTRIGIKSKTLGGQETIVYDTSTMSDSVQSALQDYMRIAPS